jgi:hypothetical protein
LKEYAVKKPNIPKWPPITTNGILSSYKKQDPDLININYLLILFSINSYILRDFKSYLIKKENNYYKLFSNFEIFINYILELNSEGLYILNLKKLNININTLKKDIAKWTKLIKSKKITAE